MDRSFLINFLTIVATLLEVFWSLTDPRPRAERIKSYLHPLRISYALFIILFVSLNYLSGMYFPLPDSGFDNILSIVGTIIFSGGVILSVWAKITMGKVWGVPAEHQKHRQNKLITTGPFHHTRNPIYIGLSMVLVGYGLALQSYFTFLALIPIYYFWTVAQKEEKLLELNFGKEYLEYQKKVPRFF